MKLIKMYSNLIITPLEKEVHRLRIKVYKNKIPWDKNHHKKYLEKTENLLFTYYKKLELFIIDDLKMSKSTKNNQ